MSKYICVMVRVKLFILSLFLIPAPAELYAQIMNVHIKNGGEINVNVALVDSIDFSSKYENQRNGLIYIVDKAKGHFASLTKAILDNWGIWGVTLYLRDGEYDLLQESHV